MNPVLFATGAALALALPAVPSAQAAATVDSVIVTARPDPEDPPVVAETRRRLCETTPANYASDQGRNQRALRGSLRTTWRLNETMALEGELGGLRADGYGCACARPTLGRTSASTATPSIATIVCRSFPSTSTAPSCAMSTRPAGSSPRPWSRRPRISEWTIATPRELRPTRFSTSTPAAARSTPASRSRSEARPCDNPHQTGASR